MRISTVSVAHEQNIHVEVALAYLFILNLRNNSGSLQFPYINFLSFLLLYLTVCDVPLSVCGAAVYRREHLHTSRFVNIAYVYGV